MKLEEITPIITPYRSLQIGESLIEVLKLKDEYCLSQTQAERAIGKQDNSTLRYQLERAKLWKSPWNSSLKVKKQAPDGKLDQIRTIHPIPLEMVYLYWQLQAPSRPQAKTLIETLGENGLEQFKQIVDSAFSSFEQSQPPISYQSNPQLKPENIAPTHSQTETQIQTQQPVAFTNIDYTEEIPCGKLLKFNNFEIEIFKFHNIYCLSQKEVFKTIDKSPAGADIEYCLRRFKLWHSTLPEFIIIKKLCCPPPKYFLINFRLEAERNNRIKPVPLDMAYLYWKVQAINGQFPAIELMEALGDNGLERLMQLANDTFNATVETEVKNALNSQSSYSEIVPISAIDKPEYPPVQQTTQTHNFHEWQQFKFEGKQVRMVGTPDTPSWIAQDVCDVLGIAEARSSMRDFDEDERGVHTMHITEITGKQRLQPMLTVTEPGMYRLLLKSRKPIAKRFKRWVFHEVLPAIRKTGYYSTDRSHDYSEFSELEQDLERARYEIKQYQAESYKLRLSIERTKFSFNHLVQETTHVFSLLNSL